VKQSNNFDIIVVGGGHAGIEAAVMSSRLGAKTAIITFDKNDIGTLSCNPAMGGLGKGHLIREIDAMGGVIGKASDLSGIQFRVLNKTRGEAVQGPRAQIDREKYKKNLKILLRNEKIKYLYDEVLDIILDERKSKKK
jgi:NAD/FAD-utilizing enzyme apparently involved in cell division